MLKTILLWTFVLALVCPAILMAWTTLLGFLIVGLLFLAVAPALD